MFRYTNTYSLSSLPFGLSFTWSPHIHCSAEAHTLTKALIRTLFLLPTSFYWAINLFTSWAETAQSDEADLSSRGHWRTCSELHFTLNNKTLLKVLSCLLKHQAVEHILKMKRENYWTHFLFSGDIPPYFPCPYPLGSSCPFDGQQLGSSGGGKGKAGPGIRLPKWHPRVRHRCSPVRPVCLHWPRWTHFSFLFVYFLLLLCLHWPTAWISTLTTSNLSKHCITISKYKVSCYESNLF